MRFLWMTAAAAILAAALAGCCSAEYSIDPVPDGTITPAGYQAVATGTAYNSGYYLFNTWALSAGHTGRPNTHDYRSFRDNVRPDRNSDMLLEGMRRLYKADRLADVRHTESAWGYFSLWIVWRRTIATSAIGLKKVKTNASSEAR